MSSKIIHKSTNKSLALSTAIKKYNLLSNITDFIIPSGFVIVKNKTHQLVTKKEAQDLIRKKTIKLNQVWGDINLTDKVTITQPKVPKKQLPKINTSTIRYLLNTGDKLSSYALHHFIRDLDLKGESGRFVVMRNNRILFERELDIPAGIEYKKWWESTGYYVGIKNSIYKIWTSIDRVKGSNKRMIEQYYPHDSQRPYDVPTKILNNPQSIDNWIINEIIQTPCVFYWITNINIKPQYVMQVYRENTTNTCFWAPLEDFVNNKIESVKLKKNWYTLQNKIIKLKSQYSEGVPHSSIQDIVNELQLRIEITDIFGRQTTTFHPIKLNNEYTVKYLNTRFNHVDVNRYIDNQNVTEELELHDLQEKMVNLLTSNEWFYYVGTVENPVIIHTQDRTYIYKNEDNEIIKNFNKSIKINDFSIHPESEKYKYLSQAVNYRAHCAFKELNTLERQDIESNGEYFEYDLKRAYTQYKKCKYYVGFPNMMSKPMKLNDWTVEKCKQYIGYYCVTIQDIKNDNTCKILSSLGINKGQTYLLSSPEVLLLFDHGVKLLFISGCFSYTKYDFDISTELMDKKLYAIWAGKLNSVKLSNTYRVACSEEMAYNISTSYPHIRINKYFNKRYNSNREPEIINEDLSDKVECCIELSKKETSWLGHIGGFITAYTRCTVINELLKIDHDNIVGFKLDGFIIKGTADIELYDKETHPENIWAKKPVVCDFDWGFSIFSSIIEQDSTHEEYNQIPSIFRGSDFDLYKQHVLLSGPGGTGKTHYVLSNLPDCMYTAGMWRLICEKIKDYNVKGLTIHQIIGLGCESYLMTNKPPSHIIIDEVNMIDEKLIKQVIKLLPYTQIILCGDIEVVKKTINYYQCSLEDVTVFSNFSKFQIKTFTTNYRCKDDELLNRLDKLRKRMRESNFNKLEITNYVRTEFKDRQVTEHQLIQQYNYKKDWVLCSTTSDDCKTIPQTRYYTELLKGNKYLCIKHTREDIYNKLWSNNAVVKGEIVTDPEKVTKRFERRDAFTMHSFQGLTVKNGDLYIDTKRIFCPRQLYTAISRVEYLNQIYIL